MRPWFTAKKFIALVPEILGSDLVRLESILALIPDERSPG